MADQNTNKAEKPTLHPGSSVADAKAVGGSGDFGVAEQDVVGRAYTSRNTKQSDRGAAQQRSGESEDDVRTSGAGGTNSGVGSSSGGDVDNDLSGLSAGSTEAPVPVARGGQRAPKLDGSTVQLPDENDDDGQGADAVPNAEDGSDASVGEVSSDEATGRNDAGD